MNKSTLLNRRFFIVVLTVFVFVCGIQMMETSSAAKWKLIDKGSKKMHYFNDEFLSKITWKAYKKGNNYVKVKGTIYTYEDKSTIHTLLYIKKVKKNKIKVTQVINKYPNSEYVKTKLSAVKYYWKQKRPFILWAA